MDTNISKEYTNGEVTIVWKPGICIHSTLCWKTATGLPEVFNPREKPWIKPEGADTGRIVEQVNKCPSGALSFYYNNEEKQDKASVSKDVLIEITPNGPLLVHGDILLRDKEGNEISRTKVTALCRCGHSRNKPYCDGSHTEKAFEG